MPRNEVKKIDIDSEVFKEVVHACGVSINQLGDKMCSTSTLYRSLAQGKIREKYLEKIARYLNVDTRLLTGDYHKQAYRIENDLLRTISISNLRPENYPYYPVRKQEQDENEEKQENPLIGIMESVLPLFDIPLNIFDAMNFEERWLLEHDFLCAILPVIRKHFDVDNRGRAEMPDLEYAIIAHEDYREEHDLRIIVDGTLRKELMENPPDGYTAVDIARMDTHAIICLDMERQGRKDN